MRKFIVLVVLLSGMLNNLENICANNRYALDVSEIKQSQTDVFEKLADIKDVEVVYISKSFLGMMGGMNMPGVNIGNITEKLEGLQIFSAEQKNAMKALKQETNKLVKERGYETLMFVKDNDTKTAFYTKRIARGQTEMLMVSEEPSEISIIRFFGNFTVQDIQNIAKKQTKKK